MFLEGGIRRKSPHAVFALRTRSKNACACLFLTLAFSVDAGSRGGGGGGGGENCENGESGGGCDPALAAVALDTSAGKRATHTASGSDEGRSSRRFAGNFTGNETMAALAAGNYGALSAKAAPRTASKKTCPREWSDPRDVFAHPKGDWRKVREEYDKDDDSRCAHEA